MSQPTDARTPPPRWGWRLAAPLLPVIAMLYAHLRGLPAAWSGRAYYGCAMDADRCDVLYTLRLAHMTQERLADAWRQVDGPWEAMVFLFRDLWQVAAAARVHNLLDLLLLVLPLRGLLAIGPTLLLLHLGLLALACLGGYAFARSLDASPLASSAAGLVAGASGIVVTCVSMGHYPQALLPLALGTFAGLVRLWRGQRGGILLTTAGASLAAMFYWQNVLILAVGGVLLAAGAVAGRWRRNPQLLPHLMIVAVLCFLICLPAAIPLIESINQGTDWKLEMTPWGTPYLLPHQQGWTPTSVAAYAVLDAVPLPALLSPKGSWLFPAFPLFCAALLAARRRENLPWLLLVLLAILLVPGPLPVVPEWTGASAVSSYGPEPRLLNPVYTAFFRWVPTAARMHHALRWGTLLATGLCALTALGLDELLRRSRAAAVALLVLGLGWAIWGGSWPIPLRPFPGGAETDLAGCREVLLAPIQTSAAVFRTPAEAHLLEGVIWKSVYPLYNDPQQGWPDPTPTEWTISTAREQALDRFLALQGDDAGGDLPAGNCVLVDMEASRIPLPAIQRRFAAIGVTATRLDLPAGTFHKQGSPRALLVYRIP